MTLVTAASGGQDISVGAVMAVAAAVCCQILSGGEVSVTKLAAPIALAILAALLASALCGAFNAVSYTHLDVYKRQDLGRSSIPGGRLKSF